MSCCIPNPRGRHKYDIPSPRAVSKGRSCQLPHHQPPPPHQQPSLPHHQPPLQHHPTEPQCMPLPAASCSSPLADMSEHIAELTLFSGMRTHILKRTTFGNFETLICTENRLAYRAALQELQVGVWSVPGWGICCADVNHTWVGGGWNGPNLEWQNMTQQSCANLRHGM